MPLGTRQNHDCKFSNKITPHGNCEFSRFEAKISKKKGNYSHKIEKNTIFSPRSLLFTYLSNQWLHSLGNEPPLFPPAVNRNVANEPVQYSVLWLAAGRLAGFLKCERTENVRIRESEKITTLKLSKGAANRWQFLLHLTSSWPGSGNHVSHSFRLYF